MSVPSVFKKKTEPEKSHLWGEVHPMHEPRIYFFFYISMFCYSEENVFECF